MFPYNEALITALIRLRQAEIQRESERYHLARAARAAQPPRPPRLAGLLQCLRRWSTGGATRPRLAGADREERWVA
jgi:hypothetical protein